MLRGWIALRQCNKIKIARPTTEAPLCTDCWQMEELAIGISKAIAKHQCLLNDCTGGSELSDPEADEATSDSDDSDIPRFFR